MSPFPVVETERLTLRPYRPEDAERVLAIRSRLDVVRWLDNPPHHLMADLDEARAWIETAALRELDDPSDVRRAIVPHTTGVVAGTVLVAPLREVEGGHRGEHELGWHLHPDSTGHGWATEAAGVLADQAFAAGHRELVIGMYPDNHPSAAVALRLGAEDLGVLPDPWYGGESRQLRLRREHR
ncbi:MAG: GNAT family N-acetyltransferase [Aeromicrobium erythreum]